MSSPAEEMNLTGGPNDDWIIYNVSDTEDSGSDYVEVDSRFKDGQTVVPSETKEVQETDHDSTNKTA